MLPDKKLISTKKLQGVGDNRTFFRSLNTKWIPAINYRSFAETQKIIQYIIRYSSQLRPYQYNGVLTLIGSERLIVLKTVTNFIGPLYSCL
ncbi:hypothetical protein VCRA2119O48_110096 [Vibrio crassostreae]|nr:hypothetical protein VCRA2119O48_110096 [Vibrio crassostreae]CAK3906954.1 hypothetical protein VCRA212O16_330037 [Vibrio crassostreae]